MSSTDHDTPTSNHHNAAHNDLMKQLDEQAPAPILMPPSTVGAMGDVGGRRKHSHHKRLVAAAAGAANGNHSAAAAVLHGPRSWKNSRRSRNGNGRGLPKKGGAGGKGVWGAPGSELLEAVEDAGDPNYDHTGEETCDYELSAVDPKLTDEEVRVAATPHLLEYFETGDAAEAARCLEETIPTTVRSALVRCAIELAMDHRPSHRELTSVLLAELVAGHVLANAHLEAGFASLLQTLPDLCLDLPDAATVLGNFFARAVADECIAPRWINEMMAKEKGKEGGDTNAKQALHRAHTLLSLDHGLVRLHNVWGVGGALRPVQCLTRQMALLLREFVSSGDVKEAARCVRALEVPHFHHELVYEAIVMALEANRASVEEALASLLHDLAKQALVSTDQMERGFLRVFTDLRDISMDVPLAYILLDRFVERCCRLGFLSDGVTKQLPSRGRKRFVSEGDQHFVKNHRIL